MGQKVGKATFIPDARPFLNANRDTLEAVWVNFNQVAEGFGLNLAVFQTMCQGVPGLRVTADAIEKIFASFDSDRNGLVDALEFLTTFALASGMSEKEKIQYTFRCYDFDESNELTVDEMTLSLKSTLSGLAKLTGLPAPDDLELEDIAQLAFSKADKNKDSKITFPEYQEYCLTNPEVRSWIAYYDDPTEATDVPAEDEDSELELEGVKKDRSQRQEAANDPDVGIEFVMEEDTGGDEFMAVKPWLGTVLSTTPSSLPRIDPSPPDVNLTLEWVHGYRAEDSRNNLRYNADGEVVYPAAGLGVVYNADDHKQRFCVDHNDDVMCMALHPGGEFVATGEMGAKPKICVWDSTSRAEFIDSEISIRGFHRRAVLHLTFSPDGRLLASVGQDDDHSVALWNWRERKKHYSDKSDKNKVLAACFRDDGTLVTCGVKHIYFWDVRKKSKKKGLFGRAPGVKAHQALMSLAPLAGGAQMASGTASGHIYAWQGRNCVKAVKAHERNCAALYSCESGLVSGGKDGKVKLWTHALEARGAFDIAAFGSYRPSVRSVCWDPPANKLLVGTIGSEVYEMSSEDGTNLHAGPVVQGHCRYELWGLSVHPERAEYATVGDDGTLRVWDAATRKQLKMKELGGMARAVAYSPDGNYIAVGMGGRVGGPQRADQGAHLEGAYIVFRASDLVASHQARDARAWVSDVKYSPDGQTLAIAAHDNKVYLYNTVDFSAKAKCRKSSSYITHVDFSADSVFVQTNDGAYELLYYDAETGVQQVSAPAMKDVEWATWTCTLGWPVQGIWPAFADGTDINSVDRSHNLQAVATADDFGQVKLLRNPCVEKNSCFNQYRGHSSHVTNVRWLVEDSHLISVGGNDKCIMQWRADWPDPDPDVREATVDLDTDDEVELKADGKDIERSDAHTAATSMDFAALFEIEANDGGDEFTAVKPWIGAIVEPTEPPPEDSSVPDEELVLEWVHGYRALDSRNNLRYSEKGELVYPAAGLGVVFSTRKWHQRYHHSHTDDVICLAMHPDRVHVATGQMGKKPTIVVWRADTMEAVATLKGLHRRAVCQLAFSNDGRYLASVGQDDDHTVGVYDWQNRTLKSSCKGDKNKSLGVAFSPDGNTVCQVGVKHIRFHQVQGRNLRSSKGILRRKGQIQPFLCVEYLGGTAMVGTADGHIYQFVDRELKSAFKGHTGATYALYSCAEGLVSGGKDGLVKLWNPAMDLMGEYNLKTLGSVRPAIRSVCWDPRKKKLLVGTQGSEIFELSSKDGVNLHSTGPVMTGHYRYEVWGLAWHPTKPEYATVGDDGTLRVWDATTYKQLKASKLGSMARAVAYSPDGNHIAVGLGGRVGRGKGRDDGKWMVLRESDLEKEHDARDSRQWISDVKYSPDGKFLGIASHDNKVYFYNTETNYTIMPMFEKHNSYLTHFDFSSDSKYLQSNDGAYELLFADVVTGTHIPSASALKDVHWHTWTCTLGWPVQGIWPAFADGTDVNAVDRSHDETLLASADDFGRVKLFRYPVTATKAAFKEYRGHSSHVTNIRWGPDDRTLVSVGGNDRCVFQWRLDDKLGTEPKGVSAHTAVAGAGGAPPAAGAGEGTSGEDTSAAGVALRPPRPADVATEADDADDSDVEKDFEMFQMEVDGGGDEFTAVKPWTGAVVAPTHPPEEGRDVPNVRLDLEWVYGYRGFDSRNNLRYNDADGIVYHTAGVGVVYDRAKHAQKFYRGHDDDIVSLAVDPSGNFVATGQMGARPRLHIWDSESGARLCVLPRVHRRAIVAVAFSPDGKQCLSVGNDDSHSVALSRSASGTWEDGKIVARAHGDPNKVLWAEFLAPGGEYTAATGGVKHVRFWKQTASGLVSKKGIWGSKGKIQPLLCATAHQNKLLTGTVTGDIYVWQGNTITQVVRVVLEASVKHKSVTCLFARPGGLVSGHKDGTIRLWSDSYDVKDTFNVATDAKPRTMSPAVRSVCLNEDNSVILVGTLGCEIYEVSVATRRFTLRAEGHFRHELWGLATHPSGPHLAVTGGDDRTVRVWDLHSHTLVNKTEMDTMCRAVAWSPDGAMLGLGLGGRVGRKVRQKDGAHAVLRADTLECIHQGRDSKQWIQDVKFNASGTTFAVASHDNVIYLYDARGGRFSLKARCTAHHSYISHIDFSADGAFMQSNSGDYELLFWNASNGDQMTSATSTRDVEWHTWTCTLGWPVQGIWPAESDGTDINGVDRSHSGKYVATSDDFGRVRVFSYPVITKGLYDPVVGEGHSSHVTNVRWNADDSYLLTTGGNDKTLFQWKVVET